LLVVTRFGQCFAARRYPAKFRLADGVLQP
jgi:hypothetical protein